MKKKIITFVLICCMVVIIAWIIFKQKEDSNIKTQSNEILGEQTIQKVEIEEEQEIKQYPKEEIIEEYKGYEVSAKLEIPKIFLETYILKYYSEDALNTSVTEFESYNPNEIGNFCVVGHNYKKDNMFYNLKQLELDDTFYVSDNVIGKIEYVIYDIYKVYPEDLSCLSQETNGKRIVTLITCTNDAKMRIVIKAQEVES